MNDPKVSANAVPETTSDIVQQRDRLFHAIGATVVVFQQIELWLSEEIALMLRMREREDQHLVAAAMSFRQKIDLLIVLLPRKSALFTGRPPLDLEITKNALFTCEDYRNRVVHSFYTVDCSDENRWKRLKGSLRGRGGFSLNSVAVNNSLFEDCNKAMTEIRNYIYLDSDRIVGPTKVIRDHLQNINL